jgi:hypothetical protein
MVAGIATMMNIFYRLGFIIPGVKFCSVSGINPMSWVRIDGFMPLDFPQMV